ncbi:MAG: hypothetical protein AB7T31_12015 [Gemmatimonadales bacterium]
MLRSRVATLGALGAVLAGCGGAVAPVDVGGEDTELTGTFAGAFRSVGDGMITLDGYLTLELAETSPGQIVGGFTLEGVLDDGVYQQSIAGSGPLEGSVSQSSVAPMSFTATPDFCPDHTVDFSGTYYRRTGALLVAGAIDILDPACAVQLTFPSSIPMQR